MTLLDKLDLWLYDHCDMYWALRSGICDATGKLVKCPHCRKMKTLVEEPV